MATYKKLWASDEYQTGIYDRCDAAIYVRQDGLRVRVERDTIKWTGNTGGYHRNISYVEGRQKVKALVRRLRLAQVDALCMGLSRHNVHVINRVEGLY